MLYRVAKTQYADLRGGGAAQYPGRWNVSGQKAVYTSLEVGVPVLEKLVHIPKNSFPLGESLMRISVRGNWTVEKESLVDLGTGGRLLWFRSLAAARDWGLSGGMAKAGGQFAAAVPSVVVPAWNVVLYPDAKGFSQHVAIEETEDFEFDERLFSIPHV